MNWQAAAPPLPLRLRPFPGESWLGYTKRLAKFNGGTWTRLMSPLYPVSDRRPHYPLTAIMSGVASTPTTIQTFARYFGLTTAAIEGMHLSRFAGSAISLSPTDYEAFDPLLASRRDTTLVMHHLGLVAPVREPRACPECLAESPQLELLTWRLGWHLVCVKHRALITRISDETHPRMEVRDEHIRAQQCILNRLTVRLANQVFFTRLDDAATHLLGRAAYVGVFQNPESLARALPDLVDIVDDPGYPLARGLVSDPEGPLPARHLLYAPTCSARDLCSEPNWFPRLLPLRHLLPDLADLCEAASPRQARVTGAVAVHMATFGTSLAQAGETLAPGRPRYIGGTARLLLRIEDRGRLEKFWSAVDRAAHAIQREGINYRAREAAAIDPGVFVAATTAEPTAHRRMIRTWLVDQWACAFTSTSNARPSVRNGLIEDFDRRFGTAMTQAIEQHLERAA